MAKITKPDPENFSMVTKQCGSNKIKHTIASPWYMPPIINLELSLHMAGVGGGAFG